MPSNFSSLRSNSAKLLTKLKEEHSAATAKAGADERFWKLTVDQKSGRGYARIRFLPAPKNEELPWARFYQHNFKGPTGAWLVENCLTTRGNAPCPICKSNSEYWNKGDDANQKIARDRKRKQQFIANILVLEDPSHPENNGKVFLFKYGVKIQDKIMDAIEPKYPDQVPFNPFHLWEGADFKLKAEKKDGFTNYDKSEFATAAAVTGTDKELEKIWESEYSIAEFVSDKAFKSYETLEKRLTDVTTGQRNAPRTAEDAIKVIRKGNDVVEDDVEAAAQAVAQDEEEEESVAKPQAPEDDEEALTAFFTKVTGKK